MKTIINYIKTNLWQVLTLAFAFLFLMKGCTNNKISRLEKEYKENTVRLENKIDSLTSISNKKASAKEVRDQMELIMFDYLIYEDDLDKGKSSLSDIKNKIQSND